jgi:two-component system OmpR family response regulator
MARVLVVDDNGDVLEVIEQALADAGHEVTGVRSAERARQHLQQGQYDAAVIDYVMPQEDGLSLAHFLRGRGVPVLIISAVVTFDELHEHGMPILGKPFSAARLEEALQRLLEPRMTTSRER